MSESSKRVVLTRREALLLSASAGIGMVGGESALAPMRFGMRMRICTAA